MKKLRNLVLMFAVCSCIWSCSCVSHSKPHEYCHERYDSLQRVIKTYAKVDSLSWCIIRDNGLLDIDGSDNMSDYLEEARKLDKMLER